MAFGFVSEDFADFMLCQLTLNIHNGMVRLCDDCVLPYREASAIAVQLDSPVASKSADKSP